LTPARITGALLAWRGLAQGRPAKLRDFLRAAVQAAGPQRFKGSIPKTSASQINVGLRPAMDQRI
jgi:hypothetical protein